MMRVGYRVTTLAIVLVVQWAAAAMDAPQPEPDEVICPRVAQPPRVDGALDDPCWQRAAQVAAFTKPRSSSPPAKGTRAQVCFDDRGVYIAVVCLEPRPQALRARARDGSSEVWQDDCVEIWLRTGDSQLEYDQFIVGAGGARQWVRSRLGTGERARQPDWPARVRRGRDRWVVELALPFTSLGVPAPAPGSLFQLKLGREDHPGGRLELATWPPGSEYGGTGEFGRLYFETANLLANPDMTEERDGKPTSWGFNAQDRALFATVTDEGRRAIRFTIPGRYAVAQQSLRLRPHSVYRLSGRARGTAGAYLRARVQSAPGQASTAYTAWCKPSPTYQDVEVTFPTGDTGQALIIVGTYEGLGRGQVLLTDLRVSQEVSHEADGPAIPLAPGQTTVVSKVRVSDCRALRGFVIAPVDGRLDSYNWDMATWEYNMAGAGAGVSYTYRGNNGLHITLADGLGVDAVQIRGGARVKLYQGAEQYDSPGKAPLIWRFRGHARCSRALFPKRVGGQRFSFFDLDDGRLADVTFLRTSRVAGLNAFARGASGLPVTGPGSLGVAGPWAQKRFSEPGTVLTFGPGVPAPFTAASGKPVHLVAALRRAFPSARPGEEVPLAGLGLRLSLPDAPPGCPLTVAVQDPLNPRQELMGADLTLLKPGTLSVVLDHPDQVIPANGALWLTLTFGAPVTVREAAVYPYVIPRAQAIPEALEFRKLVLKGLFCILSEARQWGLIRRDTDLERWYRENHWGEGVRELAETIAQCKALGPTDDRVRCYDEWFSRSFRDLPPFEPRLDRAPGAPEWANLVRQAWLTAREVPRWWLDHRLVPTGEFGGEVGDDTDMYQNYADFPMLETDGVAARLKDAAARLAELAEERHLENGLNRMTTDSLHAYEEGINHESLMLWWNYGDPVYFERCLTAARSMPALTVVTSRGHRHFKSDTCGAEDLRIQRPLGTDGQSHPLLLHPCFEVAWYNRSPRVLRFLREWGDGWLEHQQPGAYASVVDVKTERAVETNARPLSGSYGGQACAHVFLFELTGDRRYVRPFMDVYEKGRDLWPARDSVPELWHRGALDHLAAPAREAVLRGHKITAGIALGDRAALCEALKADIAELQRFGIMYTDAEVFTDRVFLYAITNAARCYTGGFATRNRYHHSHAASWDGFGTDFAALVLRARPDRFRVLIYNFRPTPLSGSIRLWTLDHGRYRLTLGPDADGDDRADRAVRSETVEVARASALPLTLPPRVVTVLDLEQIEKLDPIWERADLALSRLDTQAKGSVVSGVVHNIGGKDAPRFTIALVDAGGKTRASQQLGPLAAPHDLEPKRIPFRFTAPTRSLAGWRVVVDPEGRVPDLFRGNNAVGL